MVKNGFLKPGRRPPSGDPGLPGLPRCTSNPPSLLLSSGGDGASHLRSWPAKRPCHGTYEAGGGSPWNPFPQPPRIKFAVSLCVGCVGNPQVARTRLRAAVHRATVTRTCTNNLGDIYPCTTMTHNARICRLDQAQPCM